MFSLILHSSADQEDSLVAELWESGTTGIVEEPCGIRAFFDRPSDPDELIHRFAEFSPELREEAAVDWEQATRDAWPPLVVGRFFLVAPWRSDPTPPGLLRLEVNPGMACGTGRHPATQLCLEAIGEYVEPGDRVLDVGTGSGILSAAALLVGASSVVSCDIDPLSIEVARERAGSSYFVGSADAVRPGWADFVVANIDSATLERIAPELRRVRSAESKLILSGFPDWDAPEGFEPTQVLSRDGWLCFVC